METVFAKRCSAADAGFPDKYLKDPLAGGTFRDERAAADRSLLILCDEALTAVKV
jgi:hypothetical protein